METNVNVNHGKDLSNTSAHSGTTGLISTGRKKINKKHAIFIKGMYLINECIYKGQFHNTYKGINKITRQQVMIKMCNQFHDRITNETKMFKLLKEVSCIPRMLFSGEEKINGTTYFVRVTESYGPSIKMLHAMMGHSFSLSTICIFAIQMLGVLEEIHKGNVVHRNLKPRKIVIHNELKSLRLFVLDLKYSRKYKHKNGQLVRYTENSRILNKIFCNKFSSIGSHLGISPSRKDDMESLGYIFLYFFRKGNMFGNRKFKQREEKLKFYEEWKLSLIPELLTNEMPIEFVSYFNYVKAMNIHDAPEYEVWRKAFKQLLFRSGINQSEYTYEWIPLIKTGLKQTIINNSMMNELIETPSVAAKSIKDVLEVEDHNFITTHGSQVNSSAAPQPNDIEESSKMFSEQNEIKNEKVQPFVTAGATEEDTKKRIDTVESANGFYGHVEIDLSEINNNIRQPSNQSSITFGGQQDSEHKYNTNNNNNTNARQSNTNKSNFTKKLSLSNDSPGLVKKQSLGANNNNTNNYAEVIFNPSSLTHEESSHLLGKNNLNSLTSSPRNNNEGNLSNYSTDDLSIIDDESQNSLAALLLKQPEVLQLQRLIFRHRQPA